MTMQKQADDNPEKKRWNGDPVKWPEAEYGSVILIKEEEHSMAYMLADLVVVAAFELESKQASKFVMAAMAAWDSRARKGSLSILTGIGGFPHPLPPIRPPRIPKGMPGYLLGLAAHATHTAAGQLGASFSWANEVPKE